MLVKHSSEPLDSTSCDGVDFLSNLSEELLDRIASALSLPGDLRALSMTSRAFYRIVLPHFFAHIDFRPEIRLWGDCFDGYTPLSIDMSAKFRPFAALMLQRSDLAYLVRSFCMHPGF